MKYEQIQLKTKEIIPKLVDKCLLSIILSKRQKHFTILHGKKKQVMELKGYTHLKVASNLGKSFLI